MRTAQKHTFANDLAELSAYREWGQASRATSYAIQKAPESQTPRGCKLYLVPAQGCEDESVLSHNAVWELLLPILILCCPQGERELGELGLIELLEINYLLSFQVKGGDWSSFCWGSNSDNIWTQT